MKKIICIILIILPFIVKSEPGYEILKGHKLPLTKIRDYNKTEIVNFIKLFDSIFRMDQDWRKLQFKSKNKQDVINSIKKGMKIDSITYNNYKAFFEKTGYFSFRKTVLSKWITDSVSDFLLKHYTMQLHYSDCWAFDLMRLIEKSIQLKSCNEEDLMDYFVTYLDRQTEFNNMVFCGKGFHVVLLPNLDSGPYCQYYSYAYCKTLLNFKSRSDDFAYVRVSNVSVSDEKKFDWSKTYIKYPENKIFTDGIMKIIKKYGWLAEQIIKGSNPYSFKGGTYNVLICNHPNLGTNPNYDF